MDVVLVAAGAGHAGTRCGEAFVAGWTGRQRYEFVIIDDGAHPAASASISDA